MIQRQGKRESANAHVASIEDGDVTVDVSPSST